MQRRNVAIGHNIPKSYDEKIFTAATLLSSHLIYNSNKLVDQNAVDQLQIFARLTQLFQVNNVIREDLHSAEHLQGEKIKNMQFAEFPPLSWVSSVVPLHWQHFTTLHNFSNVSFYFLFMCCDATA